MRVIISLSLDVFTGMNDEERVIQKLKERLDGYNSDPRYKRVFTGDDGKIQTNPYWSSSVKFDLRMEINVTLVDRIIRQTVAELKSQLDQVEIIHPLFQSLTFNGRLMRDEEALSFYKIVPDSTIQLELNSTYEVHVQYEATENQNERIMVIMDPNSTIHDLKRAVEKVERALILKDRELYYNGWLQDDLKCMKDYNIKKGLLFDTSI